MVQKSVYDSVKFLRISVNIAHKMYLSMALRLKDPPKSVD